MKHKMIVLCLCILIIIILTPNLILLSATANGIERQKFYSGDLAGLIYFEYSVCIDGNTAIIGTFSPYNPSLKWAGSVYICTRTNNIWMRQQHILAPTADDEYCFGWSVSISGDTALIGVPSNLKGDSPGSAYVYTRIGTTWTQQAKLSASDAAEGDLFGTSVSLDGDTALIGAYGDDDNGNWSGSAYVFTRIGTTWTQQAKLLASDGVMLDSFGGFVSLDSDTALIGAPGDAEQRNSPGFTYVFTRTGIIWTQQAKLFASDGVNKDQFGISVSLDGDTALIGACGDNNSQGSAYVFTRTDTTWTQQAKLFANDGQASAHFGYAVSLSQNTALIGAYWDRFDEEYRGSTYVFTGTDSTWSQQQKLEVSGKKGNGFGISVSLDGDTALIAAFYSGDVETYGSAYVFIRDDNVWIKQAGLLNAKINSYDNHQMHDKILIPDVMYRLLYSLHDKLPSQFPNAFLLLGQLMGY